MKIKKTYTATIHVGLKIRRTGTIQSYNKADIICQEFVDEIGECVSFAPTNYIYTHGGEPGVIVQFIQYPRFPKEESEIKKPSGPINVVATRAGFFKRCRKVEGDKFTISDESQFSKNWMKKI